VGLLITMFLALTAVPPSSGAPAVDRGKLEAAIKVMDGAKGAEADVFAPKAWARASERLTMARAVLDQGGRQQEGDKIAGEASEYAENAIKAGEVCKLSLKQYLDPRNRARVARAPTLAPDLYTLAEQKFIEATGKVEGGDVKGGLKKAAEAGPLFDVAEDGAIRVELLGAADKLIATAVVDEAVKYAPSTLDAARAARKNAADILTKDRYNRAESVREAARAEYEARHASNIAMSVRSLNRNDQAWEKLMLLYEIQMNRVGKVMGWEYLPFDNGPIAAADSLVAFVARLRGETARTQGENDAASAQLTGQIQQLRGGVTQQLQQVLARLSVTSQESDPVKLAELLDHKVTELVAERAAQDEKVKAADVKLAELSATQQKTSAELGVRQAKEERFTRARQILNPSEGEILSNASGDVVLRLSGLSFDPGKADIKDQHVPLLQKVESILKLYPAASYVIEGHTDASGEGVANQQLSEKRAFALMQYLRQGLSIPVDRIKAIGYGADKPIALSTTPDGRAKNRRIDILILQ
jgi:outer membrane protein OmpA-like peptidoglycan-associated protein